VEIDDLAGLMGKNLPLAAGDMFHWKPAGVALLTDSVKKSIATALGRNTRRSSASPHSNDLRARPKKNATITPQKFALSVMVSKENGARQARKRRRRQEAIRTGGSGIPMTRRNHLRTCSGGQRVAIMQKGNSLRHCAPLFFAFY